MIIDNTSLLDGLIVGRIDPHIYAFRTNTVPDYLKVGDTYRPVSERLKEWKTCFSDLVHDSRWEWVAKTENGKYFRDFAVHYYLETIKGLHRLQPDDLNNLPYYSREFFKNANPEDVDAAIKDIEAYAKFIDDSRRYQFYSEDRLPEETHYCRTENYPPRPNQEDTIKKFMSAREAGRKHLLMYAVMRFGKSFTSFCCAKEMEAKVVLILSAKADVHDEWKKTVESHKRFEGYYFLDSKMLKNDEKAITKHLGKNERVAVFLTLQDLVGDDIKEKHKELFNQIIDLLIVDETHFGARADEYGKILREAKQYTDGQLKKEQQNSIESTFEDLEKGLDDLKELKVDTTLHLSGTPYRILMGSEFKPEDIIAFYQFTDIIDDKDRYDKEHINDEDYNEWDNPYYGFPQMIRFAFNPNESARKVIEKMRSEGKSSQLNELFRPKSITKDTSVEKLHQKFAHEDAVLDLLHVIDGTKEDENLFGFLNYEKLKEGKMCRHMVFVLPFCASCDAMEKLLKCRKDDFINLKDYEVVNISGIDNIYDTTDEIKNKIKSIEKEGKKSISLTVNRMLTGSTVKEWDTMLFFKDVSSPQEYDQAIFRLQNQYITTYKDENGDTIKYNMKPQTLLVDFDPNRMFYMQEQKAMIYNVNNNERGNDELTERLRKEIEISPIIVINKGKIGQVTPADIMNAVREYSANKTVMDEATAIPTDFDILNDPNLWDFIKEFDPIDNKKGLNMTPYEGEGEDYIEPEDEDDNEEGKDKDPHEDTDHEPSDKKSSDDEEKRDKRLAAFFARILFFALLTNDEVKSLQQVIDSIKTDAINQRIARNVGLNFKKLCYVRKHINPFVLSDLDYKISNINDLLSDDTFEPLERVERALRKFGRLSISEIVTPADIADKVVSLLPTKQIESNFRFFDIASKQGEFACAIYKKFGEKIKNNIYALPTSTVTYEFTRKVFELLNIPIDNIISEYTTYDLLGKKKEQLEVIIRDMKINAIVGNPPYQLAGASGGNNDAPIYQVFSNLANDLTTRYATIILPSRWFAAGRENLLGEYRKNMLTCGHIKTLITYSNGRNIFPDVELKGGICYYLYDKNYNGTCDYTYNQNGIIEKDIIDLSKFDILIRDLKLANIVSQVTDIANKSHLKYVDSIISSDTPFGIPSNPRTSSKTPFNVYEDKTADHDVLLYHIENQKRKVEFAAYDDIKKNKIDVDKPKVFIPGSGGSGNDPYVLGKPEFASSHSVCSQSYLYAAFDSEEEAHNFYKYLCTKFLRVLVSVMKITQSAPKRAYRFVPLQDFSKNSDIDWSKKICDIDKQLYKKYNLDVINGAIEYIESNIKPL